MIYQQLALNCPCGEIPEHIAEVGFTGDHSLVIHWWCKQCQKVVCIAKPLADCWRECPSSNSASDRVRPTRNARGDVEEDTEFLRSIGVRI